MYAGFPPIGLPAPYTPAEFKVTLLGDSLQQGPKSPATPNQSSSYPRRSRKPEARHRAALTRRERKATRPLNCHVLTTEHGHPGFYNLDRVAAILYIGLQMPSQPSISSFARRILI